MSLSTLSIASPEALAFTGCIAMGLVSLGAKLWPTRVAAPAAALAPRHAAIPAAVLMPPVPVPVVAPPNPPVNPTAPVFGPLPPVVSYSLAITVFNNLFANAVGTALLPFVGHGITATGLRIVGHRGPHVGSPFVRVGWMQGALVMMGRLRRAVIVHGNAQLALPAFNVGHAAAFAESRMFSKIFQVLPPNNARLVGRGGLTTTVFHFCGQVVRGVGVPRRPNNVTYPLIEYGNLRSDVSWTVFYFLIAKAFLLRHGASLAQAEYIACCAVIEAVGVAYGQAPGAEWGITPSDFGFVTPATLPQY